MWAALPSAGHSVELHLQRAADGDRGTISLKPSAQRLLAVRTSGVSVPTGKMSPRGVKDQTERRPWGTSCHHQGRFLCPYLVPSALLLGAGVGTISFALFFLVGILAHTGLHPCSQDLCDCLCTDASGPLPLYSQDDLPRSQVRPLFFPPKGHHGITPVRPLQWIPLPHSPPLPSCH